MLCRAFITTLLATHATAGLIGRPETSDVVQPWDGLIEARQPEVIEPRSSSNPDPGSTTAHEATDDEILDLIERFIDSVGAKQPEVIEPRNPTNPGPDSTFANEATDDEILDLIKRFVVSIRARSAAPPGPDADTNEVRDLETIEPRQESHGGHVTPAGSVGDKGDTTPH